METTGKLSFTQILMGSHADVYYPELLGFFTSPISEYSEEH
jgi:hypothetical protein